MRVSASPCERSDTVASAIRIETVVQADGRIEVSVPGLTPGEKVTVTVETQSEAPIQKRRAADILAELPGHLQFKTAEEVDAYIREERESWDR
jgi:hypothetical protein